MLSHVELCGCQFSLESPATILLAVTCILTKTIKGERDVIEGWMLKVISKGGGGGRESFTEGNKCWSANSKNLDFHH